METGEQCAMMGGPQWMPMWLVDSLATPDQVCKQGKSLSLTFPMTGCHIFRHRFNTLFQCTLWTKQ